MLSGQNPLGRFESFRLGWDGQHLWKRGPARAMGWYDIGRRRRKAHNCLPGGEADDASSCCLEVLAELRRALGEVFPTEDHGGQSGLLQRRASAGVEAATGCAMMSRSRAWAPLSDRKWAVPCRRPTYRVILATDNPAV